MKQPDLSVAIVVPWLPGAGGVAGHRTSIDYARELASRGLRVDFVTGRIFRGLTRAVGEALGNARFHYLKEIRAGEASIPRYARHQYSRILDRQLAKAIAKLHSSEPIDFVLVAATEGHWLPAYLRAYVPGPRPLTSVCVTELVEHPFWLGYERNWTLARLLLSPLYPAFHAFEAQRLQRFDLVFSNSSWTSALLDYFYGIRESPTLGMVGRSFFEAKLNSSGSSYIAVPTASLDAAGRQLIERVHQSHPNLRTYGRRSIPGIPHAGFLSESDMISFLAGAAATLFVFDYEALGLIPLESLAVGTPVVTIPKQGPYAVLANNPNVRFGCTAEQLAAACSDLERSGQGAERRLECRNSVSNFHPDHAVDALLTTIQTKLRSTEYEPPSVSPRGGPVSG